jgi:hypothetical protein
MTRYSVCYQLYKIVLLKFISIVCFGYYCWTLPPSIRPNIVGASFLFHLWTEGEPASNIYSIKFDNSVFYVRQWRRSN